MYCSSAQSLTKKSQCNFLAKNGPYCNYHKDDHWPVIEALSNDTVKSTSYHTIMAEGKTIEKLSEKKVTQIDYTEYFSKSISVEDIITKLSSITESKARITENEYISEEEVEVIDDEEDEDDEEERPQPRALPRIVHMEQENVITSPRIASPRNELNSSNERNDDDVITPPTSSDEKSNSDDESDDDVKAAKKPIKIAAKAKPKPASVRRKSDSSSEEEATVKPRSFKKVSEEESSSEEEATVKPRSFKKVSEDGSSSSISESSESESELLIIKKSAKAKAKPKPGPKAKAKKLYFVKKPIPEPQKKINLTSDEINIVKSLVGPVYGKTSLIKNRYDIYDKNVDFWDSPEDGNYEENKIISFDHNQRIYVLTLESAIKCIQEHNNEIDSDDLPISVLPDEVVNRALALEIFYQTKNSNKSAASSIEESETDTDSD